ncbi:benzoate/H(+) symporter BenE family transporter [Demequina gelatinilytica]|uniref:benzoate/H(+) symporter BenE family transporter n=1 Tax=Demequina gelatinilytica TaxID=1638980 RepID=UPI000781CF06|nr:benzoate/H(+) symporter BenE family transporter [Demequina gelatinilytica]
MERTWVHAAAVGVTTALVGFTSSVAVLIAGLTAAGADADQASSGLLVLCVSVGLGTMVLSWRMRTPITLAWSTPGAALLATQASLGWAAAVGAFLVTGFLIAAIGLWPWLGRLVASIPAPLAQAMLAGVLVPLCLRPVTELAADPWPVAVVIVIWLALQRLALRWATPTAFAAALAVIAVQAGAGARGALVPPTLDLTAPEITGAAVVGIALPLTVVTMASQNVPGIAVLASAGFRVPWRATMLVTGAGTALGAAGGGHAVNLAAITAALPASPDAARDPERRWIAAFAAGCSYLVLAGAGATLVALSHAGTTDALAVVAGLALLPTLASSLAGAFAAAEDRIPAAATFMLAASGATLAGIGSAFWALVGGLAIRTLLGSRTRSEHAGPGVGAEHPDPLSPSRS